MEKSLNDKLLENHVIFITSDLNESTAASIINSLMLWSEDASKPEISIYVSSYTNNFDDAITIYDVLEKIDNPLSIYTIGNIGGFALLFLAFPSKGKRYALKHTLFSIDQPSAVIKGGGSQQTEVGIIAKETTRQRAIFENILSNNLAKPLDIIHNDAELGKKLDAEEALKYGLIDVILE